MAGLRLGGLASGMDTETIITQLMAVEAQPRQRFVIQQSQAEGRKTALADVARQVRALSTSIADLRSVTTWGDVQTIASSDATKVTARQVGSAPPGNVTIDVTKLARVDQHFYDWGTGPDAAFQVDGVGIDMTGVAGATDAAARINAQSGVTVYAGVMNGQLVLTGKRLGQDIAVTGAGGMTLATEVQAQKTEYSVNGVPQTPTVASVVQPPGLPGVELTLKAQTTGPVSLSIAPPGPDPEAVKTKVKAFVDAYNATVDIVRTKLGEQKVKSPTTAAQFATGALRNDPALSSMLSQLRTALGPVVDATATADTLAEIGIGIAKSTEGAKPSADALAGKLTLDTDKLTAALTADPTAVETLFGGGGATGISQALDTIVDPVGKTATGYLARSTSEADDDIGAAKDRQANFDRRLTLREERLRSMFTAMETALNQSQSQSSWLQGQLSSLPSWG